MDSIYTYDATLVRVIDGDTVRLRVSKTLDFGFYIHQEVSTEQNFRLYGIDTAEIRGEQRPEGLDAKAAVERLLTIARSIKVRTYKPDKYGRWLVDICTIDTLGAQHINQWLIDNGYAVAYDGGKR